VIDSLIDRRNKMARTKIGISGKALIESKPKKTYQGCSNHTKYAKKSNSHRRKKYRGQGR
jgi:hypothetical protein